MSPPRVVQTSASKSRVYLKRGESLLALVGEAERVGNHDAVVVSGIQASIAFADAYTVSKIGARCRGQDHSDVIMLIASVRTQDAARLATLLQRVLDRRSALFYGDVSVGPSDSARISRLADAVAELVRAALSKS